MAVTLADIYQGANISLQPETFTVRQQAITAMSASLTDEQSVTLTRFYFGLTVSETGSEWFRSEVAKTDSMFSLVQKEREAAVIAEAILWQATQNREEFPATVVASASANGLRVPIVNVSHIDIFRTALKNMAVRERTSLSTDFVPLPASTVTAAEISAATSLSAAGELYARGIEELRRNAHVALSGTQNVLSSVVSELQEAREELDILSWLIGGWSRLLNRPFSDLPPGLAAVAVGVDLADLSKTIAGPHAAASLIRRALLPVKKARGGKTSVLALGNSAPAEDVKALNIKTSITAVSDLCPIFFALSKSAEVGHGAWMTAFEQSTSMTVKAEMEFEHLALQAMHERMVTGQL